MGKELATIDTVTSPRGGKYRLSDMELDFVSLVPAGDDPSAVVVIAKAAPEGKDLYVKGAAAPGRKKPGTNKPHAYDNASDKNGDKSCDMCGQAPNSPMHAAFRKRVKKRGTGDTTGTNLFSNSDMEGSMGTINKSDLDPEVREYVDALEDEVTTLAEQVEKAEADITERDEQIAKMAPKDDESADEIAKSMLEKADPAIRALIEKQNADLALVRKQAEEERESRLTREYLSKAEELPMVTEDKPSLASLLRAAAEKLEPEQNETLEKVLKSANEALRQSGLLGEVGTSYTQTTVSKSVEGKAEELRKADPSLTIEQATERVYRDNPDLFAQAMTEQEG